MSWGTTLSSPVCSSKSSLMFNWKFESVARALW